MDLGSDLEKIRSRVKQSFQESHRVLSFEAFLEEVLRHPYRHLRTAPAYMLEMFEYFGRRPSTRIGQEATRFRLFDLIDPGGGAGNTLVGQERVQNLIHQNLQSFAKRGKADKMLLLHGPNGSGKTTLVECVIRGLEVFSRTPEGTLMTVGWVFTDREGKLERIGFESGDSDDEAPSYVDQPEKDLCKISCELRDPPLFIVPQELRSELVAEALRRSPPPEGTELNYQFFLDGDLCQKCRKIYDRLLVAYKGDWRKVVRHVQVERFYLSKRYRTGAVSIEPQGNVDAGTRPITSENAWNIPALLRNVSLYEPVGDIVDANRGILEYSDLLKRPLEMNKYLLTTCERGTVNLSNCVAYLDLVIMATANEKQLSVFKRTPDFSSFKGRMELIPVPYLLRYSTEAELYRRHVRSYAGDRHVTPHTAKVGALWAVLTRLRRPNPKHYSGALAEAVGRLTPLEKARLYDTGEPPDRLPEEEKKELRAGLPQIRQEYAEAEGEFEGIFGAEYEGRRGASPREVMTVFARAAQAQKYRCLTPMSVFDALEELMRDVSLYDFLRLPADGPYHDVPELLEEVRREYFRWVTEEVYDSINLVEEGGYDRVFLDYFRHVKAHHSKETVYNAATNSYESPNQQLMASIESLVGISETADEYRSNIMTRIAAWSLDHRREAINYHELFPTIHKALRDNFYRERNRLLTLIEQDILKYGTDEFGLLSPADQKRVLGALETMRDKYRYCDYCARDVIAYVLKYRDRLAGDG